MRKLLPFLFAAILALPAHLSAQAHHEYLAKVNYQNFGYTRIDSFPNVTYIFDNTAYDQNTKRFFFQGSAQNNGGWKLFTVNPSTGAIISQALIPSNLSTGHVCCLQYDNNGDTLYGIYYLGTSFSSCWIEPATGIVHIKQALPAFINGYAPAISAYDENHHRLIFWGATNNGGRLIVVDARTGAMVAANALSASGSVCNIEYDNTADHLYGVRTGTTSLDSIEVLTGVQHIVAPLPSVGLMQNGISAIDEANHLYIFCGKTQPSSNDSLFTVDLQTGAIVNEQYYYGFANSASLTGENIIFYCFDQLNGQLYALNWGIEVIDPQGIAEQNAAPFFSVFPVPAADFTEVVFSHKYAHAEIRLYNSLGGLVNVQECENVSRLQLSLENLSPGIYFVSLEGDGEKAGVQRVIIQ